MKHVLYYMLQYMHYHQIHYQIGNRGIVIYKYARKNIKYITFKINLIIVLITVFLNDSNSVWLCISDQNVKLDESILQLLYELFQA